MTPEFVHSILGLDTEFSSRESGDLALILGVGINVVVGSVVYLGSSVFYKEPVGERKAEVDDFFEKLDTPVEASETGTGERDSSQGTALGILSMIYGGFVVLLALIPNPMSGRLAFLFCGGVLLGIGAALAKSGRRSRKA